MHNQPKVVWINSLPAFIALESIRYHLSYAAVKTTGFSPPWTIVLAAATKLVFSIFAHSSRNHVTPLNPSLPTRRQLTEPALYGGLAVISSYLWSSALNYIPPSMLFVTCLFRIPLRAVLRHWLLVKQLPRAAWISLILIVLAVLLSYPSFSVAYTSGVQGKVDSSPYIGYWMGIGVAVTSSVAFTFGPSKIETAETFWQAQTNSYVCEVAVAVVGLVINGGEASMLLTVPNVVITVIVVAVTALSGIVHGIRGRGALGKDAGLGVTVLVIMIVQTWHTPTPIRIALCILFTVMLASFTSSYKDLPSLIHQSQLEDFELTRYDHRIAPDLARYFAPNNITPAIWGNQPPKDDGCIYHYLRFNKIYTNTTAARDFETTLAQSGCPIYPSMPMLTHVYRDGPWLLFQLITIDSWLATQRLSDGHKLVYWYTVDPGQKIRERYAAWTGAGVLEFRVFDPATEAKGTCIEGMREWWDEAYQKEVGWRKVSASDLIRTLLLSKYGGIWLDTDDIVLRDLTPLIRAGPMVPQIRSGGLEYNDNFLIHGPLSSGISAKVLETACSISYNKTIWPYPDWMKPIKWHWVYNDGLYKICRHRTHCGVGGIPIWYMDGWAWRDHSPDIRPCRGGFEIGKKHPDLRGMFIWHGRFNQVDENCFDGTRADRAGAVVWDMIDRLLDEREAKGKDNGGVNLDFSLL
ncbi:hypothetical protein HDV00_011579 [Rhizophlyctis rosea]|nr:hypothetical protein HDV00_011579 [Rhizophlyctis rosea]